MNDIQNTNTSTYSDNQDEQNDLNPNNIRDKDTIFEDIRPDRYTTTVINDEDKVIIDTGLDPFDGEVQHHHNNVKIDVDKSIDTQDKDSLDPNQWDSGDTNYGEPTGEDTGGDSRLQKKDTMSEEDLANE